MATFIEDLGIVSAYGEAVSKGYTGTEEEFAEMLANLPDKLAEAREYATSAAESSASAASSAAGVQRNASIASTAASDAQSAAASALQSATFAETTVEGIEEHEEQCRIYRAEAVAAAEELKTTTLWNDALIDETVTGKIASFSDGCVGMPMKSIVAEITPIQDLNGQANPYPPGGGKNLFSSDNQTAKVVYRATVRPFEDNVNAYYLSGAPGAQDTQTMAVSAWAFCRVVLGYTEEELTLTVSCKVRNYTDLSSYSGAYGYVGIIACDADGQGSTTISRGSFTNVGVTTVTATATIPAGKYYGLIFSPVSSATKVTLTQYTEVYDIQLEKGSTATAYAPYSNICPISGRTGLTVTRAGVNLLNWESTSTTINGVTFTGNSDGTVTANGTATADASLYANAAPHTWLKAGAYVLNGCPSGGNNTTYMINETYKGVMDTGGGVSFTMPEDGYVRVRIVIRSGYTANNLLFKPMIRPASISDGTFVPYNAQTIPITWESIAGTVYGGTLDVVSGVLTVDKVLINLGNITNWRYNQSGAGAFDTNGDVIPIAKNNDCICTNYKTLDNPTVGKITSGDNLVCINKKDDGTSYTGSYAKGTLVVKDSRYSDVETFKSAMDGVMLCYTLATPQTYQLTPTEVRTILGENLVYSDADDVTVNYYVDMKGYIDKRLNTTRMMIAGVETSFVATKNYAIGDFVIVNDTLYRITAVITSGETITPGTNASETTVAEQLIALYNA